MGGRPCRKGLPNLIFTEDAPRLPAKPENAGGRYVVPCLAGTMHRLPASLKKGVRLAPRVGVLDEQAAFVQHFKHG